MKLFYEKAYEIKTRFKLRSTIMRSKVGSLITKKTVVGNRFKNVLERTINQSIQNELCEEINTVEQHLESPTEDLELAKFVLCLRMAKYQGRWNDNKFVKKNEEKF